MKKLLISALIILLLVMAYFAIFKGISVANFHLLSVEQIGEENDKLTQEIAQTEILMNNDYQTKLNDLKKNTFDLMTAKEEYYNLEDILFLFCWLLGLVVLVQFGSYRAEAD